MHHVLPALCWPWQRGAAGRVMKTQVTRAFTAGPMGFESLPSSGEPLCLVGTALAAFPRPHAAGVCGNRQNEIPVRCHVAGSI